MTGIPLFQLKLSSSSLRRMPDLVHPCVSFTCTVTTFHCTQEKSRFHARHDTTVVLLKVSRHLGLRFTTLGGKFWSREVLLVIACLSSSSSFAEGASVPTRANSCDSLQGLDGLHSCWRAWMLRSSAQNTEQMWILLIFGPEILVHSKMQRLKFTIDSDLFTAVPDIFVPQPCQRHSSLAVFRSWCDFVLEFVEWSEQKSQCTESLNLQAGSCTFLVDILELHRNRVLQLFSRRAEVISCCIWFKHFWSFLSPSTPCSLLFFQRRFLQIFKDKCSHLVLSFVVRVCGFAVAA